MPSYQKSDDVPFSAARMFAIVHDIERYPEFVPWCEGARIIAGGGHDVTARLLLARGGAKSHYEMRNRSTQDERLDMELLDGPFNYFLARWLFDDLPSGSQISLDLSYQYANPLLGFVFDGVVRDICKDLIVAFEERADELGD